MSSPVVLSTERLLLVPLTRELMERRLAESDLSWSVPTPSGPLVCEIPLEWPGEMLDLFVLMVPQLSQPTEVVEDTWVIICPERRQLVGACGTTSPLINGEVEIGYGMNPSVAGRGLATEAVGAMIDAFRARPTIRRVIAHTKPGNLASQRVLGKLGFERSGQTGGPGGPLFRFALELD